MHDYLERVYLITHGSASSKDFNLSFIYMCSSHLLNQIQRFLSNINISKKHFEMRVVGRMICCQNLKELTKLVVAFQNDSVKKAVEEINALVNDFENLDQPDETELNESANNAKGNY